MIVGMEKLLTHIIEVSQECCLGWCSIQVTDKFAYVYDNHLQDKHQKMKWVDIVIPSLGGIIT